MINSKQVKICIFQGTLKSKIVEGFFWSSIERLSVQGINFILGLIIARLLSPNDYGAMAMLTVFLALSNSFVDSGFSNALVRKTDRTEIDNSTVFYFNVVIGVLVYIILFFSSPIIAQFYKMPILTIITRIVGLSVFFNSLCVVQQAILTTRMDFKTQAIISIISVIISGGIGFMMAYCNYGVWALVSQIVLAAFIRLLLLWWLISWKPLKTFSTSSFNELFSFGSKLLLSNIVVILGQNISSLIIGKKFSATQLGFYNRAEQLSYFPVSNMTSIIQRVTFPTFSKMQSDMDVLRENYLKVMSVTALIIFPIMAMLFILSPSLILLILTEKWESSIELLQILIFNFIWWPFFALNINILSVLGFSRFILIIECIKAILNLAMVLVLIQYGIKVVCIGFVFSSVINLFVYTYFTKKTIGIGWKKELIIILPYFIISIFCALISFYFILFIDGYFFKIVIGSIAFLVVYGISLRLFKYGDITLLGKILSNIRKI